MTESGAWMRFVLAVLATWRITHLLVSEDGPGDLVVRLRVRLGASFAGRLMDCFYCLSVWVAAPLSFFVGRSPVEWIVAWLALSGAACLLERTGQQPLSIQSLPASQEADRNEGENYDVLRPKPGSGDGGNHAADNAEERFYSATRVGSHRP